MVYLYIADGTEELEFVTIADVLRRAGIEVKTVSYSNDMMVTGAHGIPIQADAGISDADPSDCDMIVIPGGMPGVQNLIGCDQLTEDIKKLCYEGKPAAAICAGPMVLEHAEVLKGKKATIYPGLEDHLEKAGASYLNEKVVIDGNILTSQGPGTALDFAFAIVEFIKDTETADSVKKGMLLI